jgi:hypothetical protein
MFPPRRVIACGIACCSALTVGVVLGGCIDTTSTTTVSNTPYAVLFGHVTTANNSTDVLVSGQAYLDSANARNRDSVFGGFTPMEVDANGNYSTRVSDQAVQKVYFDISAMSTRPVGADTVYAVPLQLDSLGGAIPHDSLEIDFTLP